MRRTLPARNWKTVVVLAALGILSIQIVLLLTSEATTAAITEAEKINGKFALPMARLLLNERM